MATLNRIAEILRLRGDFDSAEVRRSKAIGILAQPAVALQLFWDFRNEQHPAIPPQQPDEPIHNEPSAEPDRCTGQAVPLIEDCALSEGHNSCEDQFRLTLTRFHDGSAKPCFCGCRPAASPTRHGWSPRRTRPHHRVRSLRQKWAATDPDRQPRPPRQVRTPAENPQPLAGPTTPSRGLLMAITEQNLLPGHRRRHPHARRGRLRRRHLAHRQTTRNISNHEKDLIAPTQLPDHRTGSSEMPGWRGDYLHRFPAGDQSWCQEQDRYACVEVDG